MEAQKITNIKQNTTNNVKVNNLKSSNVEFSTYLGETKSLDSIFESASQKYNVSVDLLKAVGKAESGFDTKAVSRSGAQGVMQLMPATAKELGVKDSFDAEQNIMGGAKYLSQLSKKYNGDTKLTLAAYNAGSGNVAKYGGIPPFKETQNYVVKVMGYMKEGVSTGNANVKVASVASSETPNSITIANYKANLIEGSSNVDRTNVVDKTNVVDNTNVVDKTNVINEINMIHDTNELSEVMDAIFSYGNYEEFLEKYLDIESTTLQGIRHSFDSIALETGVLAKSKLSQINHTNIK